MSGLSQPSRYPRRGSATPLDQEPRAKRRSSHYSQGEILITILFAQMVEVKNGINIAGTRIARREM